MVKAPDHAGGRTDRDTVVGNITENDRVCTDHAPLAHTGANDTYILSQPAARTYAHMRELLDWLIKNELLCVGVPMLVV